MATITASIVLYKTPEWQLNRLLQCLFQSSICSRIYIVDNSPEPLEYKCLNQPEITLVRSQNNGYGAGHNIAMREIINDSEFHFVLNPDIYFGPRELQELVNFIASDRTIGLLMPKVVNPDGSLQYLCKLVPSPIDLFLRRFAFGPLRRVAEKRVEELELRATGYDKIMDVPYLSGCFMLFSVLALRKVGLFDERFFMYPEDIDISRRMRARFRTVFYPGATIVHDHGRESYKTLRALAVHVWNMIKYFNKWGWIWDPERARLNRDTLQRLRESHQ